MNSKSLLIAIAAVALTATSAQAFNGEVLLRADLTDDQRVAFETAKELQDEGRTEAAQEVLVSAGIDEAVMERVRLAMNHPNLIDQAVQQATTGGDYQAFKLAIANTPLADIITNEDDFIRFKEAHDLKQNDNLISANESLDQLSLLTKVKHAPVKRPNLTEMVASLSPEEQEALLVARRANDVEAIRALLSSAGAYEDSGVWSLKTNRPGQRFG